MKIKNMRNFHKVFQEMFGGFVMLTEMLGDKIFLTISNLYFLRAI
jgi:hypothetical protein